MGSAHHTGPVGGICFAIAQVFRKPFVFDIPLENNP